MKRVLRKTWKVLVLVAVLTAAAFPFMSPPVEAIPGCGECIDGSFNQGSFECGGVRSNCTECTVCTK